MLSSSQSSSARDPRDPETLDLKHQTTLAIFDFIHRNVARYPEMAGLALTPDDAYRLKAEGKVAVFIGIENGYAIGKDLSRVKEYYDLGARYITLCHSANNDICDSSTDPQGPEHSGLSAFGEEVVKEMNRLGMIIDVSHLSDEAFYDVLQAAKAPVIASHSSCRALCENPRNLNDDMLLALKKNGGVIQICLLSEYLKQPEPNPEFDRLEKELRQRMKDLGPDATDDARGAWWGLKSKPVPPWAAATSGIASDGPCAGQTLGPRRGALHRHRSHSVCRQPARAARVTHVGGTRLTIHPFQHQKPARWSLLRCW